MVGACIPGGRGRFGWALALLLLSGQALAAPPYNPENRRLFDLQLFRPAIDSKGYITTNASQVLGLWDFSFGLVGTVANAPLRLEADGKRFGVDYAITPSLQAALGFRYAELAVTIPAQINSGASAPRYISPSGNPNYNNGLTFASQGIGDIGIHAKGRILNSSTAPIGLGLLFSIYVPSGNSTGFLGDGGVNLVPTLIIDREFGRSRRFRLALNAAYDFRLNGTHTFQDNGQIINDPGQSAPVCAPTSPNPPNTCGTKLLRQLGDQIRYGLGGSYAIVKQKIDLVGEIFGAAAVNGVTNAHPLEGALGFKVYLARNSFFSFGGGGSFIRNQTQGAVWRAYIGFIFEPLIGDRDGDGIKDDVDKCPDEAEDLDGFQDKDGCPELDNDNDGIPDQDDKCPDEAETKNGFEDEDGCPDKVSRDSDGDGILDELDKCPNQEEDHDGFQDGDGCPEADNDGDGVLDVDDLCPNEAEDKDDFEDQDGCPEPDNDNDRILDKDDKCPTEPETYNGYQDTDGCPDKGRVVVRRGKLEILDKIYFETGRSAILPVSFPILDAIAATLKGNPQIQRVEIQGHADERGNDQKNLELTEVRAQAVRTYLVEHGVEAERLEAHGYGETKPVCLKHNQTCWSQNRRVEFVIVNTPDQAAPQTP
ncbi:MAG TPA: OmpA family protein [Polyangia bacterium]|nr:OmpA family protein [Polyangia bacterium]